MYKAAIIARCGLSLVACLGAGWLAIDTVRSGECKAPSGLAIKRSERPGRFWFFVLGALALSVVSGTAAALVLWIVITT